MSTLLRSTLIALAVLTSASAAMARPHNLPAASYNSTSTESNPNTPQSVRAFWDERQRWRN